MILGRGEVFAVCGLLCLVFRQLRGAARVNGLLLLGTSENKKPVSLVEETTGVDVVLKKTDL